MSGAPKTTPSFGDLLGELPRFIIRSYSQLRYSKRIDRKISKGKGKWSEGRGNQVQASKSSLPVDSHRTSLIPLAISCDNIAKWCLLGKLITDSSGLLIGSWFIGTLCLAFIKIPDFYILCKNNLGTVSHYHLGKVLYQFRELFANQVSRCQPVANLISKTF